MSEGIVKFFDKKKGWGMLTVEGQADLFVHYSDIFQEGFRFLEENQRVSFEQIEGIHGRPKATDVKVILE